jgi:hypothetical protein
VFSADLTLSSESWVHMLSPGEGYGGRDGKGLFKESGRGEKG